MSGQLDLVDLLGCQRWGRRSCSWRPGQEIFDPARYGVEVIPGDADAKAFISEHHYSGSYPAARLRVGLYRLMGHERPQLVGVAVFSVPSNAATVPAYLPQCTARSLAKLDAQGLPWPDGVRGEGVELGRLVLLDEVPGNGETWFLARAFEALRSEKPHVRGVLSYSDPVPRRTSEGAVIMPGHVGTIYQALNGFYAGRGKRKKLRLLPGGVVLEERALSKIRGEEQGIDYACRQLGEGTGVWRRAHEDARAYVKRALASPRIRVVEHPGNHAYVWAFHRGLRAELRRRALTDYPKEVDDVI